VVQERELQGLSGDFASQAGGSEPGFRPAFKNRDDQRFGVDSLGGLKLE
jgi:hypothetical protein